MAEEEQQDYGRGGGRDAGFRHALDEGATQDEIIEAAQMAVLMNGGPAMSYLRSVFDTCDEFDA